jgi:hypothetical protein
MFRSGLYQIELPGRPGDLSARRRMARHVPAINSRRGAVSRPHPLQWMRTPIGRVPGRIAAFYIHALPQQAHPETLQKYALPAGLARQANWFPSGSSFDDHCTGIMELFPGVGLNIVLQ